MAVPPDGRHPLYPSVPEPSPPADEVVSDLVREADKVTTWPPEIAGKREHLSTVSPLDIPRQRNGALWIALLYLALVFIFVVGVVVGALIW